MFALRFRTYILPAPPPCFSPFFSIFEILYLLLNGMRYLFANIECYITAWLGLSNLNLKYVDPSGQCWIGDFSSIFLPCLVLYLTLNCLVGFI